MNIQVRFPLGLSSLISFRSKRLSRVFSSTTVWKHQFFGAQPSWSSNPEQWTVYYYSTFCGVSRSGMTFLTTSSSLQGTWYSPLLLLLHYRIVTKVCMPGSQISCDLCKGRSMQHSSLKFLLRIDLATQCALTACPFYYCHQSECSPLKRQSSN